MKRVILLLGIVLGITSGCGSSAGPGIEKTNQESIPDTEAFQDEFTREFMKSAEETEEGYYTFESKTKGYTILFPKNATVSVGDYSAEQDKLESLSFGEELLSEKISYFIKLDYEDNEITDEIGTKLKLLSSGTDYEGEYKKIEKGDKVIYLSDDGPKNKDYYYLLAYVKSTASNKAIRFSYVSNCNVEEKNCELITEKTEERINQILYSIGFVE